MAETKNKLEREYTIPLRRFWLNVPFYERTGKAIKTIKKFVAKHMRVTDRDVNNVKLDVYMNNELWFKGRANPPAKIKVKVIKEGEIVKVTLADTPDYVKFHKAKMEKRHKANDKKAPIVPAHSQQQGETKTDEQKQDEKEKEKSTAEANTLIAEQKAKEQKHTSKVKEESYHRMAMKK